MFWIYKYANLEEDFPWAQILNWFVNEKYRVEKNLGSFS